MPELPPSSDRESQQLAGMPRNPGDIVQLGQVSPDAPLYADPLSVLLQRNIPPPRDRVRRYDSEQQPLDSPLGNILPPTEVRRISPVDRAIGPLRSTTTIEDRHPGWPKINLELALGPHGSGQEHAHLGEKIKQATIYLYEDTGGGTNTKVLQHIADTPAPEDPVRRKEHVADLMEHYYGDKAEGLVGSTAEMAIYNLAGTGVLVGHIDLRPQENDPVTNEDLDAAREETTDTSDSSLDEIAELTIAESSMFRKLNDIRETIILGPTPPSQPGQDVTAGRFETEMASIFEAHPELLQKEDINVLASFGTAHITLFHRARAAGVTVTRSFYDAPAASTQNGQVVRGLKPIAVLSANEQLFRADCYGVKQTALDIIKAFAIIAVEKAMYDETMDMHGASQAEARYARYRAADLTDDDARHIYREMAAGLKHPYLIVNEVLFGKGAEPLVYTLTEVQEYIAAKDQAYAEKVARIQADMERRRNQGT